MAGVNAEKEADHEEQLSGLKKAAVLLVTMGADASAMVLKNFNEDEVHVLGREVARLRQNLPRKSTFFFPKLLTGLTVHRIEAGPNY